MKKVITVCPYCASGCKINLKVENGKVIGAEGANGVTNQGELCLKGYFGWDFIHDTQILTPRLKTPMIRRQRGGKLESVSWAEAIEYTSSKLKAIKAQHGPNAIMTTGSSRGPGNEVNYLMQKFARAVIGTNNVDCCARVRHGPSVAGLQRSVGNGAMSNSICEIEDTACIFVFGYNAADSHPIVARRILKAKQKGAKIVVCDPRLIETARIADLHLPLKNGSNIALLNALAHVIIAEGLYDKAFVDAHTEQFDAFREIVANYTPESMERITGLSAQQIREAARLYANAPTATILWGMGVTQFYQGVETVRALASLAMLTGNLGKPNVGINPVRGQNNVQGACDMGALPNVFPGYENVTNAEARAKFAKAWGVASLPEEVGYYLSEVPHNIEHGKLKALYIMGEDPLQTEPDLAAVRKAYEQVELIIVQDIFMTKTAAAADVIFPATSWGEHEGVYSAADRGFQRFYKAVDAVGDAKHDWEIISLMATAMDYPMHYSGTQEIWDELRALCPIYYGATYDKMADLGYVQWPCPTLDHPGTPWLYKDGVFDRPGGKAEFFTCDWAPPIDQTDAEFPLVLSTVREVGHYSCRSMTGNCKALAALADEPGYAQINTQDAKALGIRHQSLVWVHSRRGKVITRADVSDRPNQGAIYMTYQWWIGACNELVAENLSPITKTPEYKYCAVRVEAIADQASAEQYVIHEYSNIKSRLREAAAG